MPVLDLMRNGSLRCEDPQEGQEQGGWEAYIGVIMVKGPNTGSITSLLQSNSPAQIHENVSDSAWDWSTA